MPPHDVNGLKLAWNDFRKIRNELNDLTHQIDGLTAKKTALRQDLAARKSIVFDILNHGHSFTLRDREDARFYSMVYNSIKEDQKYLLDHFIDPKIADGERTLICRILADGGIATRERERRRTSTGGGSAKRGGSSMLEGGIVGGSQSTMKDRTVVSPIRYLKRNRQNEVNTEHYLERNDAGSDDVRGVPDPCA